MTEWIIFSELHPYGAPLEMAKKNPGTKAPKRPAKKSPAKKPATRPVPVTRADFEKACLDGEAAFSNLLERVKRLEVQINNRATVVRVDDLAAQLCKVQDLVEKAGGRPSAADWDSMFDQFNDLIKTVAAKADVEELRATLQRVGNMLNPRPTGLASNPPTEMMRPQATTDKPQHIASLRFPVADLLRMSLLTDGQALTLTNNASADVFAATAIPARGGDIILDVFRKQ